MTESDAKSEMLTYKPPRALQTILSIFFLILLLFMVNAIAGSVWLAMRNLQLDSIIFGVMFVLGAFMLFYVGLFLFASSHSEIKLGEKEASFVLPNWRGPTPVFPYAQCKIPYDDLAAVETRSEVYRYFMLPVIVQSASLVRKDGRRLILGYVQENPQDPWIPFHTVAEQIAERAVVPITHRGAVEGKSGIRAVIQDEPPWDAPEIPEDKLDAIRKKERYGWVMFVGVLALALFAAIGFQLWRITG